MALEKFRGKRGWQVQKVRMFNIAAPERLELRETAIARVSRSLSDRPADQPVTLTGLASAIFACHSAGPVRCTELPLTSTATVTGISSTTNS